MEKPEKPRLVYSEDEEKGRKWEKEPIKIVNSLEQLGLPTLQHIEGEEITPREAVDIDTRGLRKKDNLNIVFGRPHAGELVPQVIWGRTTDQGKKTLVTIDRGTTDIFKSEYIPSVGTKISRFIADPNRAPFLEMDPKNPSVPGKVLWYKGIFDENIYKEGKEPLEEEVRDLTERFYLPYYNYMMGMIGSLTDRRRNRNERILVVDGHSFPISETLRVIYDRYGVKDPRELPLFIIGDGGGVSCDGDIMAFFREALEKNFRALDKKEQEALMKDIRGKVVELNYPFKGVHNVLFFGQRKEGVNAIQLECNEGAFINEKDGNWYDFSYDHERIKIMQKLVEKTCRDTDPILKGRSVFYN